MDKYDNLIKKVVRGYDIPKEKAEAVLETCLRLGIEPIGNVFLRKPEDIEQMYDLFQEKRLNINNYRTCFRRTFSDVKEIFEICEQNHIQIEAIIFGLYPNELKETVKYIKENFGQRYLKNHIVIKNLETLKESMPLLQKMGLLKYALNESTILGLNEEQILERTAILMYLGKPVHKIQRYAQEDRFNIIYSLTEEKYEKFIIENSISDKTRKYQTERLKEVLNEREK